MELFKKSVRYSIFLERLSDRETYIEELEEDLDCKIVRVSAIDGNEFENIYSLMKHIRPCDTLTRGMIGCTLSHMKVLQSSDSEYTTIFEDDCVFRKNKSELESFLKKIDQLEPFDILCLGANEIVDFIDTEFDSIKRVFRFWGTHALVVKNRVTPLMSSIIYEYMKDKIFIPVDWLYSTVITRHNLIAYSYVDPKQFFYQKTGLRSSINDSIRQ